MPRGRKPTKRKSEPATVKTETIDEFCFRDHLDTESVSPHLFCSICQEVFVNPQRCPCGHSYCKECIELWLKSNPTCPDDRKPVIISQLHHDFILQNIIMDQKVACPHRKFGCSSIIPLCNLSSHIKDCSFNPSVIPKFLKDEMSQYQTNGDSDDKKDEDTILLPLKMRIYQAGGSQKENLMKAFDKPEDSTAAKLLRLMEYIGDD